MKLFLPAAGNKVEHIENFQEVNDVSEVIISDIYEWTYGSFVADRSYIMPSFDDPDYMEKFEKLYDVEQFDVCIPIHDYSLMIFSKERERLSKFPFVLAINSEEVVELVSDKILTYEFFIKNQIPTLNTFVLKDFIEENCFDYPYYVKPRFISMRGTKSEYYMKIDSFRDLEYVQSKVDNLDNYVVQKFLNGTEYNIDIFCDSKGNISSIVVLKRQGMGKHRGIARGEIVMEHPFEEYIKKITSEIKLYGMNQIQAYISNKGEILFMEINARFSGSSIFVKEAGVNYFHYFIELVKGNDLEILETPVPIKMTSWEKPHYYTNSKFLNI